jgi:RNA-directed DNA polymerase
VARLWVTRYADDFIVGFQHRADAERFLEELRGRLRKFSLELHPDKTRLIEFGRFAAERRQERGERKPETFSFLGFAHSCGKSKTGSFVLVRRTMRKRMRAKLQELKVELKRRRHQPIPEQGAYLRSVVRGYYAYHGVPTNVVAI